MSTTPSGPLASTDAAHNIEQLIKAQAFGLGFDLVGIARLGPATSFARFEEWLDAGYDADMHYLPRGREKRRDTTLPFAGARSAIVVALNYGGREPGGPIARYARGADYHRVMEKKLRALHRFISVATGTATSAKPYVDTGPVLERDLARKAGLGWFGKNTNLINPRLGSYFFIGSLFIDLELCPDQSFDTEHCGSCNRCIEACPTDAIREPWMVDAGACISYQTIENCGSIPEDLRPAMGGLIYGCDICQEVCPWNEKFSVALAESAFAARGAAQLPQHVEATPRDTWHPGTAAPRLEDLLAMDRDSWESFSRGTAMRRAGYNGFRRNVAVALGNVGGGGARKALEAAVADGDELVREHAAWALKFLARHNEG